MLFLPLLCSEKINVVICVYKDKFIFCCFVSLNIHFMIFIICFIFIIIIIFVLLDFTSHCS